MQDIKQRSLVRADAHILSPSSTAAQGVALNTVTSKEPSTSPMRKRTISTYLNESIREDLLLELELLLLAFGTGIQDACTYPDFFCFASNQTGNTVLLAIGVSGLAPGAFQFENIGISLSLFLAGGWVAGQIGNVVGTRRRLWLLLSSLIQTAMVWAAVAIQYCYPVVKNGPTSYLVLSLLAFSSAAQVAMSRGLKITEITTAMATAAYVDLVIDPNLYKGTNRGRNRRFAFLLALAGGSFAGAFANKGVNSAFALLIAAIIKTIAMLGLFFNRPVSLEEMDVKVDQVLMLG
ncbi:hypothetical protein BT63DRAFT_429102 [Microthyrium microscopicum]|uniref:DUF1275 domain protein n=1 Tax=Microthyrium microscopicum TaxID=703497 RepID=A0A6A6TYL2_9PEZI|nr:hypothetical protein BT63DRAFT_429102 [Microthyrium microscopicum]